MTTPSLKAVLDEISYRGVQPGLERMRCVLAHLGNPQDKIKIIHVAGTNGKGSVCYLLSQILAMSGFKVGLTISPHMLCFNERFQIAEPYQNLADISDVALESLHQKIWESLPVDHGLTYFEYGIVLAFSYFAEQKVDFAVVETGMGGRFDATNACHSILSCVTTIGLDHKEQLGDTLEKICIEKIQIAKPNSLFLFGPQDVHLQQLAKEHCTNVGAKYFSPSTVPDLGFLNPLQKKFPNRPPSFYENAILALNLANQLIQQGFKIDFQALLTAKQPWLPLARFQWLRTSPPLVVDGAHNEHALRALKSFVGTIWGEDYDLHFGCLNDRSLDELLPLIQPKHGQVTLCHFDGGGRETSVETLLNYASGRSVAVTKVDLDWARSLQENSRPVLICGSLYLGAQTFKFWSDL